MVSGAVMTSSPSQSTARLHCRQCTRHVEDRRSEHGHCHCPGRASVSRSRRAQKRLIEVDLSEVQLETERLIMRMWRNDDFEPYFEICSDPEVMRYLGGKTFDRLEAWRHLAFIVGHWQLRGYGHWAVEEKATGTLVGRVGFLNPEGWPAFELELDALAQVLGPRLRFEAARRA